MSEQSFIKGNHKINNNKNTSTLSDFANYDAELHGFDSNCNYNSRNWKEIKAEIDNLLKTSRSRELIQKSKQVDNYWNRIREYRKTR